MTTIIETQTGKRRVRTFDTVALMVAERSLVVGDIVETAEYFEGTGGGNVYEIVASGTGTADGGSFIDVTGPATSVQAKALWYNEVKTILQFGAVPTTTTGDSTSAIQAALNLAKGANATGANKKVSNIYVPTPNDGEYYRTTDTLLIDGTHGLYLYGDGGYGIRRSGTDSGTIIRYDGATTKPVFQIKGQTDTLSNPNFSVEINRLSISGIPGITTPGATPPAAAALAGIYLGALVGDANATLNRNIHISEVTVHDCRFGFYSGNPGGLNTDHAIVDINNCYFNNNYQQGVHWGDGNTIGSLNNCLVSNNGWHAFAGDTLSSAIGANVFIESGELRIERYTSSGSGTSKAIDADIYQENGRVDIDTAWSDTEGLFYCQKAVSVNTASTLPITAIAAAGSDIRVSSTANGLAVGNIVVLAGGTGYDGQHTVTNINDANTFDVTATFVATGTGTWTGLAVGHPTVISGVRHFAGSFTLANTPNSMEIKAPSTKVSGCILYGNIDVISGLSGAPVFSGINFIRSDATFTGTGVDTQASLINIGSRGNNAEIQAGGGGTRPFGSVDFNKPLLAINGLALAEMLGPDIGDSGYTISEADPANGSFEILSNCYADSGTTYKAFTIGVGTRVIVGNAGITVTNFNFTDTTTSIGFASFSTATKSDLSTTGGDTRFLLYDVTSGQLERVKVGANGTGSIASHRMLQIPDA